LPQIGLKSPQKQNNKILNLEGSQIVSQK